MLLWLKNRSAAISNARRAETTYAGLRYAEASLPLQVAIPDAAATFRFEFLTFSDKIGELHDATIHGRTKLSGRPSRPDQPQRRSSLPYDCREQRKPWRNVGALLRHVG